jgi:flagellar hook-basal body complex protein FliE
MNIEAIAPLATESIGNLAAPISPGAGADTKGVDFMQWMNAQVGDVNSQIQSSQAGLVQLATGESGNLHHVLLELEKAKLAFQLTVQVRNKILEGYQDIMRMQI